jgi:hypothetical protein
MQLFGCSITATSVVSNQLRDLVRNRTVMFQEAVERVIPTNLRVNPLYIQVGAVPSILLKGPLGNSKYCVLYIWRLGPSAASTKHLA